MSNNRNTARCRYYCHIAAMATKTVKWICAADRACSRHGRMPAARVWTDRQAARRGLAPPTVDWAGTSAWSLGTATNWSCASNTHLLTLAWRSL